MRRISLENDFMNYGSDDLLYGYMLVMGTFHKDERKLYLSKYNYNSKQISKTVGLMTGKSKRTVDRHLAQLIERGLVKEEKLKCNNVLTDCYVFPYDANGRFQMVENTLLEYIVNTRNKCSVRIYVYLLNKILYARSEKREYYDFSSKELAKMMGFTDTSPIGMKIVHDGLDSFKREGIIDYENVYVEVVNKATGEVVKAPYKRLTYVEQKRENLKKV